jgi:NAD(P)-dependent dehydrogenase (short-subunit alcohol dehydrogenase family)
VTYRTGAEPFSLLIGEGRGVIVGFGSVAAARGRSYNMSYSAVKRALESYFESLRHAPERTGYTRAIYLAGFSNTNLALGVRTLLPKADPHRLADEVVRQLGKDIGMRYFPPGGGQSVPHSKSRPGGCADCIDVGSRCG